MLPFILINIVVSAVVILTVLSWWDNRQQKESEVEAPTVVFVSQLPTVTATTFIEIEAETVEEEVQEDEPVTYTVQAGDTLGSISTRFDVPMNDIMAANGIDNADFLQLNQLLVIPVGGLQTPSPEVTSAATPELNPSPIPTVAVEEGKAEVVITGVIKPGDLLQEAVSVVNNGVRPISLAGWQLTDGEDHIYTFGQVTLFGEGAGIDVYTGTGQDEPSKLYWSLTDAIWQEGETVTLTDSEGTIRATIVVSSPAN
jgi:LysM repeat protein